MGTFSFEISRREYVLVQWPQPSSRTCVRRGRIVGDMPDVYTLPRGVTTHLIPRLSMHTFYPCFSGEDQRTVLPVLARFTFVSVLRVRIQFCSYTTWFTSDVFRARFWRFGDTSRALSDGKAPPKGSCPAYVTVVVFPT